MQLRNIIAALEKMAPRALAESWDNSGLQVGLPPGQTECTGALVCVDVNEAVIEEAVKAGCNLVISHHPLIFKGLKSLTGSTLPQRSAYAAIRAGVAVYSAHTSLDSAPGGVSYTLAELLGAKVLRPLQPTKVPMVRVSVICQRSAAQDISLILANNHIQNDTSWDVTSTRLEDNPGSIDLTLSHTPLTRVEAEVSALEIDAVMAALESYGSSALSISTRTLEEGIPGAGLGVLAVLPRSMNGQQLWDLVSSRLEVPQARCSSAWAEKHQICTIALCGGAGGEFIPAAISAGADAYITAEIRYHDFCDYGSSIALLDIGHFESEKCAKDIFIKVLKNKFPNFVVRFAECDINPVKYLRNI